MYNKTTNIASEISTQIVCSQQEAYIYYQKHVFSKNMEMFAKQCLIWAEIKDCSLLKNTGQHAYNLTNNSTG